jgi:hypothetical protein
MSAYKLAALAAAGLLVGGSFAVSALAQTQTVMPSVNAVKSFLKGLVINGVPQVEIVVGTNHALSTDSLAAAWLAAKIASVSYTTQTVEKNVTITPAEILQRVTLGNKMVKLVLGYYATEYNASYTVNPLNQSVEAKFNVSKEVPVVDDVELNVSAVMHDVKMLYDTVNKEYYLTASGLTYYYNFYNASEKAESLNVSVLKDASVKLFDKELKIADVVKNADGNYTLTFEEVADTVQITVQGTLDLTKYGAPYKLQILDIVEFTDGSYGLYFKLINANTGEVVKEDTMKQSEFENYVNDLLEPYNIQLTVDKLAKSWVEGQPGYVVFSIVKGQFQLVVDNTSRQLPDDAAKVLGLDAKEWNYKGVVNGATLTLEFDYAPSQQLKLHANDTYTSPGKLLTLHIVGEMPKTVYSAYLYGGKLNDTSLENVEKRLVGFDAINNTDKWVVEYKNWSYTDDNNETHAMLNVTIYYKVSDSEKLEALKLVYDINVTGQVEVIGPDGTVLIPAGNTGESYISKFGIYVRKPDTVTVELRVPDDLPKITIAEKVQRVLKESQEFTLREGESAAIGDAMVKVEAIEAEPQVAEGFSAKITCTTEKPKVFTADELTKLVVTDDEWLTQAAQGTAPENAIAIGGQIVNKVVAALVQENLMTPIQKDEERIELVNYNLNGRTYKVLVIAGWDAKLTENAAKLVLQLMDQVFTE